VLYIVHFTAFCLGGPFFSGHGVHVQRERIPIIGWRYTKVWEAKEEILAQGGTAKKATINRSQTSRYPI